MARIYENFVIGNYICACGYLAGSRGGTAPFHITLLQQTPADGPLADVLLGGPVGTRLIEFKARDGGDLEKEVNKAEYIYKRICENTQKDALLEDALSIHHLVEYWVDGRELRFCARRYMALSPTACNDLDKLRRSVSASGEEYSRSPYCHVVGSMGDMAASINPRDAGGQGGPVRAERGDDYIHFLIDISKQRREGGARPNPIGGLITFIAPNGALAYIVVDDIRELNLMLRLLQGKDFGSGGTQNGPQLQEVDFDSGRTRNGPQLQEKDFGSGRTLNGPLMGI